MSDDDRRERSGRAVSIRQRRYPESTIDSFSRVDGAVEFYLRVGALLEPHMTVLDFGAGRGQWVEDSSRTRRRLRDFRDRVARVIGVDVDDAVTTNPSVHEAHVVEPGARLPLDDGSVDVVVSDFTFEHIDDPTPVVEELYRVVKPGGWVCARTPNKWGYIGIGARAVPNSWHVRWLSRLQPHRKDVDVFPVRYQLNTRADLAAAFDPQRWEHVVYSMPGEPNYAGGSRLASAALGVLPRLLPRKADPVLLIFLRRR